MRTSNAAPMHALLPLRSRALAYAVHVARRAAKFLSRGDMRATWSLLLSSRDALLGVAGGACLEAGAVVAEGIVLVAVAMLAPKRATAAVPAISRNCSAHCSTSAVAPRVAIIRSCSNAIWTLCSWRSLSSPPFAAVVLLLVAFVDVLPFVFGSGSCHAREEQ